MRSPYSPPSGSSGNSVVEPVCDEAILAPVDRLLFFDFFRLLCCSSAVEYASSVRAQRSFLSLPFFFPRFGASATASSKLAGYFQRPLLAVEALLAL